MLSVPLIVGGGIRSAETAEQIFLAGADLIIIGNGVEQNSELIREVSHVKSKLNRSTETQVN